MIRNTARKVEIDPVSQAARHALDAANGDVKDAVSRLEAAVRKDRGLRDALTDPLLSQACYDAVRREVHTDRKQVWRQPVEKLVKGRTTGAHRVIQLAAGNLLMFPLPGGKKLGEAKREEIATAASFYEKQSGDMAHKARWLQLIAQSVPNGKTVGDVLTDKRLRELQKEARNAD